jgi:hypothetical protein
MSSFALCQYKTTKLVQFTRKGIKLFRVVKLGKTVDILTNLPDAIRLYQSVK